MNLIELINVNKSYLNKTFNLTIKEDEKLLIVGSNGSGKSTLVKLIAKYLKPSSGCIKINNNKIYYLEEHIKMPNNLKAIEYIKLIASIKKTTINYSLNTLFNIPLDKYIFELSKGNKQKLALFVTLLSNDGIVILDEPLNGLDKEMISKFINYLIDLKHTIIIVTHYPDDYLKLKARVVYL